MRGQEFVKNLNLDFSIKGTEFFFVKNYLILYTGDSCFLSFFSSQDVCSLCDEAKATLEDYKHRVGCRYYLLVVE